jgi:phosphate-selective porin OprO/OprP
MLVRCRPRLNVYISPATRGGSISGPRRKGHGTQARRVFPDGLPAYAEHERADNRFDIRKARLIFGGQVTEWFRFGLEYEFQGNETSNLVDAWGEWAISGLEAVRFGQFKEPFSLEWQGADKAQWFAERSMGYYLTPMRDIGIMFTGSAFHDSLNYGVGLFNGDGDDGSTRGSDHDSP